MKKTLKQIIEFHGVVELHKQFLDKKGVRETKFIYACEKVKRNTTEKIVTDFSEKQDEILKRFALEGNDGEVLRNENGSYKMSKSGDTEATIKLKELWKSEKDVEYDIETYVATSFEGHDLTETEKEIFEGFVM